MDLKIFDVRVTGLKNFGNENTIEKIGAKWYWHW